MFITYSSHPPQEQLEQAVQFINTTGQLSSPLTVEKLSTCPYVVVAIDRDMPRQGIVGVGAIKTPRIEGVAEVGYLFVRPEYRRHGIATKLLEIRVRAARDMRLRTLFSTVKSTQSEPVHVLKENGFLFFGNFESVYRRGVDISWYFLPLTLSRDSASTKDMEQLTAGMVKIPRPAPAPAPVPQAPARAYTEIPFPLP